MASDEAADAAVFNGKTVKFKSTGKNNQPSRGVKYSQYFTPIAETYREYNWTGGSGGVHVKITGPRMHSPVEPIARHDTSAIRAFASRSGIPHYSGLTTRAVDSISRLMLLRKLTFHGRGRRRRGFTLIEAAITTVIIGVGCVAMLQLLAAGSIANGEGTELTTAMNLAGNVRECLTGVAFSDPSVAESWGPEVGESSVSSYDDLDDFDAETFSPPIDARRNPLGNEFTGWSQRIAVQSVDPDDLLRIIPHLTLKPELRPTSRITVTIQRHGKTVYTQSWIASYMKPS